MIYLNFLKDVFIFIDFLNFFVFEYLLNHIRIKKGFINLNLLRKLKIWRFLLSKIVIIFEYNDNLK